MKTLLEKFTIPVAVIIIFFFLKFLNPELSDPDFYWHLKAGEYIASHGYVPNVDPFAYTTSGKPWVAHEWLSEVIFYYVIHFFGMTGVKAMVATLLCATFTILYRHAKRAVQHETRALIISVAFFAPVMPYAAPRPQVFSFLLFSILLGSLFEFRRSRNSRTLFAIPFIMALWVNLHGAYVIGFVLLILFFATELTKRIFSDNENALDRQKLYHLGAIIIVSAVTANLNPHSFQAWTFPFYLMSMEASKGAIVEWRSPDFHLIFYKYYLALIIAYFLALIYSRKKPDFTELAISLLFICAGLVSQRHLPLTSFSLLLSFALLYQNLDIPKFRTSIFRAINLEARNATNEISRTTACLLNIGLVIAVVISSLHIQMQKRNEEAVNTMLPVKAADYIVANRISGNMFNDYGYGGYLIYRLAPERKVFIDGRADLYGDQFFNDFLAIYNGTPSWKEKFSKFSIDYVVCNKSAPIRQLLLAEGSFTEVFADEYHSVLIRKEKKNNESPATVGQDLQNHVSEKAIGTS